MDRAFIICNLSRFVCKQEFVARIVFIVMFYLMSLPCSAWRIEGKALIIEKDENLRQISHQLLGRDTEYDLIWKRCIDTLLSRDPNLIYEGVRP
jgi:hypothetical protein